MTDKPGNKINQTQHQNDFSVKQSGASSLDLLSPLDERKCPTCREPFTSFQVNKRARCKKCRNGYYVIRVKREFFIFT